MHIDVGFLTKYQLIKMHIGVEKRPIYQFDLYINLRVAICVPDFFGIFSCPDIKYQFLVNF